jgi:hypothetical protein
MVIWMCIPEATAFNDYCTFSHCKHWSLGENLGLLLSTALEGLGCKYRYKLMVMDVAMAINNVRCTAMNAC